MRVEFDNVSWNRTVKRLAEVSRKTSQVVLRDASRLVVEIAGSMTPPISRGGFGKGRGDTNKRTLTGKNRVMRDINKTMVQVNKQGFIKHKKPRAGRDIAKYLEQGKIEAARAVMANIQADTKIYPTAERWMHENQRFSGRVPKRGARKYLVLSQKSINDYIKERQKQVWKGVSGWNRAAVALKCRNWPKAAIAHHQPGGFKKSPDGSDDVWFEFSNQCPYIQKAGREQDIMRRAFAGTESRLKKDLDTKLAIAHAKASHPSK